MPVSLPAPIRGLVEVPPGAQAAAGGAEWVENFLPTERGLKVRGGSLTYAYVAAAVKTLLGYESGLLSKLFAATDGNIFDVSTSASSATSINDDALFWGSGLWGQYKWGKQESPVVSGLTSGDFASQQIGTSGGEYLIAVNGADPALIYDGANWSPLTDEAINGLGFDGMVTPFSIGETVTGASSGASAEILGFAQSGPSSGTLFLGAITGTFTDNETITSAGGFASADGAATARSSIAVSGVDTAALSDVWLYRNRLFFIEGSSLTVWYLPASSVGGTALDLSL
ncbi:hypothetical protein, partial [Pararhodobacter sp. CCB-MM2]|uniref:hypothetical protein n=1 Tax=Pararhodobacter sp. CCB-MM2 TaxID=1786003 RepID=UPI0018F6716F